MGRFDILRQIQQLDPVRDHVKIQHLVAGYEFPWDNIRALEIALYRTYCVPSISALLDRTTPPSSSPKCANGATTARAAARRWNA
jgi:hypothetical protein